MGAEQFMRMGGGVDMTTSILGGSDWSYSWQGVEEDTNMEKEKDFFRAIEREIIEESVVLGKLEME